MLTSNEMCTVREEIRHALFAGLNEIEDIVVAALDHIAEEAVTYGADESHDFYIDRVAAPAIDRIGRELARVTDRALRFLPAVED